MLIIRDFFSLLGCSTPTYNSKDGIPACGIYLPELYDFEHAEEECKKLGAFLPEIFSEVENDLISSFRVRQQYVIQYKQYSRLLLHHKWIASLLDSFALAPY